MKNIMKLIFKILIYLTVICSLQNSFAQLMEGSFEFEGRTRHYEVYFPQNLEPNMPVVFVLHGYTGSISGIKNNTKMHEVADTAGFVTVYPQSASVSWNTGETEPPYGWGMYDTTVNDVGFISALIDTLDSHYNIDLKRVYVCGHSSGGEMSFRLITELGHRFAAAASVTGPLNEVAASTDPIRPFPILHMHGTADQFISYEDPYYNLWSVEETLNFWTENNSCSLPADTISLPDLDPNDGYTVDKISYTNCSEDSIVVQVLHYKVIGGNHGIWSSTKDINASVEILNFFKNYSNPLIPLDSNLLIVAKGKSIDAYPKYIPDEGDTIVVNVLLSNPANHQAIVYAMIDGRNIAFNDSILLFDDGLHSDGISSDNNFGGSKWLSGLEEDFYDIKARTHDSEFDIVTYLYILEHFTTVPCPKIEIVDAGEVNFWDYGYELKMTNNSSRHSLKKMSLKVIAMDSSITNFIANISFPDIAPDSSALGNIKLLVDVDESTFDGTLDLDFQIYSDQTPYWYDSLRIITDVIEENIYTMPTEYALVQNYPNPFNPSTTINYSIPERCNVILKVFDMLGREVTTLENKEQSQGNYEIEFDAKELTNGIYFYRLQAGDFVETKKMILLK